MTLFSVRVYAGTPRDNLTLAGFNETITNLQESTPQNFARNITSSDEIVKNTLREHSSTTVAATVTQDTKSANVTFADFNDTTIVMQATESFDRDSTGKHGVEDIVKEHLSTAGGITTTEETMTTPKSKETSTIKVATSATDNETDKPVDVTQSQTIFILESSTKTTVHTDMPSLPDDNISSTTGGHETSSKSDHNTDKATNPPPIERNSPTTVISTEETVTKGTEQTIDTNSTSLPDVSSATYPSEKTTDLPPPERFFKWLNGIHPENPKTANLTDIGGSNNKSDEYEGTKDTKTERILVDVDSTVSNAFDPDKIPPKEFMEWLNSIHPDYNDTKRPTVTAKNIIDTSIISTEKLIIVISTICGTFVLFVAILIAISCCRRNRNIRSDSEKSDFSVTSVVSIPDKRKSDTLSTDKNGFNNLFMGIPANNEVWKSLEQLSPADSSIMPESTKM